MTTFHRLLPFSTRRPGFSPAALAPALMGPGLTLPNAANPAASRRSAGRRSRGASQPGIECMEERTMMSNIPVFEAISVTNGLNPIVQVAPMEQTVVSGNFTNASQTDEVRVQLQAGEIFTAGLDVTYPVIGTNWGSTLKVLSPNGSQIAGQTTSLWGSSATDPISGASTYNNSVAFVAPSTGTYTIEAQEDPTWAGYFGPGSYAMTLRPIDLDTSTLAPDANSQDAQKLAFSGGALYAYLSADTSTLTLSGPTGRGFTISEPSYLGFHETTTQVPGSSFTTSTIVGTGSLTINTGLGGVSLQLPTGYELEVTTVANGYGGLFGEVSGASLSFPNSTVLGDIISPLGSLLGSQVSSAEADLASAGQYLSIPGVELGIGLGSQVKSLLPNAPVNSAVPYIYLDANAGASYSVGQVNIHAGYSASVVVDPADPSIYVNIEGLPLLSNYALGISANGYIPFTPAVTPSHFSGQTLYGDFYTSTTIDLGPITDDLVPLFISEDVLVNLNTSGTGWTGTIETEANDLAAGNLSGLNPYTIALGINFGGGVSLGIPGVAGIEIPLGAGTLIIDGPACQVDVAAATAANPFAGTPVSCLDSGTSESIDGYVQTNTQQFGLTLNAGFTLFGYQIADAGVTFNNSGISYTGETSFLGVETNVFGSMNYDGTDAQIDGSVYILINDNFTSGGWGFTVFVSTNIHFNIENGVVQDWGSGWASIAFYGAGSQWWSYNGGFNNYDCVNVGSFSIWNLIDDAEDLW